MNAQNEWMAEAARKMTMLTETDFSIGNIKGTLEYLERVPISPDRKLAIDCLKAALLYMEKDRTSLTS